MLLSIYIGFLLFGKGFGNIEILLSMGIFVELLSFFGRYALRILFFRFLSGGCLMELHKRCYCLIKCYIYV